jgi:glycyl-tRNA synthetase
LAIFPLLKKDGLPEKARAIYEDLRFDFNVFYEERDTVGKRYTRQDLIGTPFCVTVDHQSLEDDTVTIRYRDSAEQKRIAINEIRSIITDACSMSNILRKI